MSTGLRTLDTFAAEPSPPQMLQAVEADADLKRDLSRAAMKIIMAADTNGDRTIDKMEASAFVNTAGHEVSSVLLQHLEDFDVDQDGAVNLAELVQGIVAAAAPKVQSLEGQVQSLEGKVQSEAAKVLALADTDQDQSIDKTEVKAFLEIPGREALLFLLREFDSYDTDGSRSLSLNEITQLLLAAANGNKLEVQAQPQVHAQPAPQEGVVATDEASALAAKVLRAAQKVMERGDKDKNALLSVEEVNTLVSEPGQEFLSGITSNFESFDSDGSGSLDINELSNLLRALSQ